MSDAEELRVEWVTSFSGSTREPQLTVYSNLNGYINSFADTKWFADHEAVDIGVVPDEDLLVFRGDDDGEFALSRYAQQSGADVSITATLEQYWPDLTLTETRHVALVERENLVVADLSPLLDNESGTEGGVTEDVKTDTAETCPDCGGEFKNEVGLNIHVGQSDCSLSAESGVGSESTADDAAVPEPEDAPSLSTVRDCAEEVDTLPELADLLDVTDGEARLLARQADVYSDLDEEVAPMGAGD